MANGTNNNTLDTTKKEVKNTSKEVKKNFLLDIVNYVQKTGKNPSSYAKENNISKQKINYYVRKLKDLGYLKKVGYGTWEVNQDLKRSKNIPKDTRLQLDVRGHAFVWKIDIPEKTRRLVTTHWKSLLIEKNIPFKIVGIHKIPSIKIDGRKVWLTSKQIIIWDKLSFFGEDAIESRKYAIYDLIKLISNIEKKLEISLKPYKFKPLREHYSLVKNELARECNRNKEKIHIKDINGEWLVVDFSYSEHELETIGKKAFDNNIPLQKWWNDHKKHRFEVTPTFVLEAIDGVTKNQTMFAKNIEEHMQVLKDMRKTLKDIRDDLKK